MSRLLWSQPGMGSMMVYGSRFVAYTNHRKRTTLRKLSTGAIAHRDDEHPPIAIDPQLRWMVAVHANQYIAVSLFDGTELWRRPMRSDRKVAVIFGDWVALDLGNSDIVHVPTNEVITRLLQDGSNHIFSNDHLIFTNGDPLFAYRLVYEGDPDEVPASQAQER